MRALRVVVDTDRLPPSKTFRRLAEALPSEALLSLTGRAVRQLRKELHTWEKVAQFGADIAKDFDRVVLLNFDALDKTMCIAPPGWTNEKLLGYLAARREEIEREFGPIDRIGAPSEAA